MDREQMVRAGRWVTLLMAGASLAACASVTPKYAVHETGGGGQAYAPPAARAPDGTRLKGTDQPYQVGGIWYVPHAQPHYDETGIASWYGDAFNMKATATGEIFDMSQFSAAHTTLPLPSMVEVTNLDNGRKMTVRVNDRGPFVGGRIIDLSRAAAQELGYDRAGTAHVRVRYLGPAPLGGPEARLRYAKASPPPAYAAPRTSRRPADEDIFAEASPSLTVIPVSAPPKPLVAPPTPVSETSLQPLPPVRSSREAYIPVSRDAYVSDVVARRSAPVTAQSEHPQGYRIQAGAFSDEDNAKRAAAQLAATGNATVEPFERSGVTFYRVYLPGPADEAEAYAVRDRVAAIGFADARVVRP